MKKQWLVRASRIVLFAALVSITSAAFGQTGKINGRVTDGETNEPLPGVNIVLEGTDQGAATNSEGFYTILNVSPGTYNLRASFIGYSETVVQDVRVQIDLTTTVNFALQSEAITGEEVIVEATTPVVQPDISANVANVEAQEIADVPVAGVSEYINLQAGIEPGMSIRGSGMGEMNFMVDGVSTRESRTNNPVTRISYTSISDFQIQTGGFNAEYGNVRSGLINVVTKEPQRDKYTLDILTRYSPASKRYFGTYPDDPNAYWMRPFLDDAVAWDGTNSGAWDIYTRRQYPGFEGWNSVSANLLNDEDPGNNVTPEEAQEVMLWRHRKDFEIREPDYEFDATLGGPVPFVSASLGNLRFLMSHRRTQRAYVVPQSREAYIDYTTNLKLTSDITENIKLQVNGMFFEESGITPSSEGAPSIYRGQMPAYPWDGRGMVTDLNRERLFSDSRKSWSDFSRNILSLKLTHTLSANTFYNFQIKRMLNDYDTNPPPARDTTTVRVIGNMRLDEGPFGWQYIGLNDLSGLRIGGHSARSRDSSEVVDYSIKFDLTSQFAQWSQLKAGLEYINTSYDILRGMYEQFFTIGYKPRYEWNRTVHQGAAYIQNKLEIEGMVANLGLRLDYFKPQGEWYSYDTFTNAFEPRFGFNEIENLLDTEPIEDQVYISPRVGISYPITVNSKLFFNYGHFYQSIDPSNMFIVGYNATTGGISRIGNPNHPMPQTIAYELGYEHSLFNQYLLRLSGYYKAKGQQSRGISYTSINAQVDYNINYPYNYDDIRGFEITLRKRVGQWIRGFVNYTFMSKKSGNFGLGQYYQNPVEQRNYELSTRGNYQNKPVPEPFGRFNVEFALPQEIGPSLGGINPLGNWRINLLGEWRAGQVFTWTGTENIPGLIDNIRWKDYYNLDMRFSKNIDFSFGSIKVFADVENVFNIKQMHRWAGFEGSRDQEYYMRSLHLPEDTFGEFEPTYDWVPGNDSPGEYRKPGVEYVPIEVVSTVENVGSPMERPLYYEKETERYIQWQDGGWTEANSSFVNQVLDDKAYIDMPNESYFTFLNPRRFWIGIRLTF